MHVASVGFVVASALFLQAASPVAGGLVVAAADPLGPARTALAEGRLDDAVAAAGAARGLHGRALEAKGDVAGACALYAEDRTATPRAAAATWRSARCLDQQNDVSGALAAYTEVAAGPLAIDAVVVGEVAAFLDKRELPLMPTLVRRLLEMKVGTFDEVRRETLADALLVVVKRADKSDAAAALERLLVELGDTKASQTAAALPVAKERKAEDLAAALKRANALAERHESAAVVAALAPFQKELDAAAKPNATMCEARILLGKTYRKVRKYSAAKKELDVVARKCSDDARKRAAYLGARVAWVSKAGGASLLLRQFVDTWPNDSFTDDVLLWLGELDAAAGDAKKAEASWQRIVDEHPSGDMIHEARFRLAMSRAHAGDVDGARSLLDAAARAAGKHVHVADRALYWRARLQLAPSPSSLQPTSDAKQREQALAALAALATTRPAGWYGHLARLLVKETAPSTPLEIAQGLREGAASAALKTSAALAKDTRFTLALALLEGGYDDEALIMLDAVGRDIDYDGYAGSVVGTGGFAEGPTTRTPGVTGKQDNAAAGEDIFVLALLVARAGAPGSAHEFLRSEGLALLPGTPSTESALAWSIDWPRAYASALQPAAAEHKLPASLLFGLSREESAFDADVVSWAGAVGLCQLMPFTAADEAKALKLPVPDVDALRDPALNARLGAAHLGRRMKGLKHPSLAIAAYNAGPGAVAKWSPAGPLDAWVESIPVEETRGYVKKVTGSWVTYEILDGDVDSVTFPLVLK